MKILNVMVSDTQPRAVALGLRLNVVIGHYGLGCNQLIDIEDLGSPGGCDAGPAFFLIFGRHRYVLIWDYLVLIG